jgi:hypothetical protein
MDSAPPSLEVASLRREVIGLRRELEAVNSRHRETDKLCQTLLAKLALLRNILDSA